jgi:hypothetical protein
MRSPTNEICIPCGAPLSSTRHDAHTKRNAGSCLAWYAAESRYEQRPYGCGRWSEVDRAHSNYGVDSDGPAKKIPPTREQISKSRIPKSKASRPAGTVCGGAAMCFDPAQVLFPQVRTGDGGGQPPRGGMGTQFVLWTSRAWVFLADALASLGSEPTRLDALAMPHEPLLSWSVYLANTPAQWLGTVDASTADDAIEVAARKFDTQPERLMAVRRA